MSTALDLTEEEAHRLAHRIAARRLADPGEWLEWEDYPMIGEYAFERLVDEMADEAATEVRQGDRMHDIDSAYLLEEAQG